MGNKGHLNTIDYDGASFSLKRTFNESSFTGPTLTVAPQHPRGPITQPTRQCVGWTGIDGVGKLNIGVADEFASP
jgi:hypothetical protein